MTGQKKQIHQIKTERERRDCCQARIPQHLANTNLSILELSNFSIPTGWISTQLCPSNKQVFSQYQLALHGKQKKLFNE